MTWRRNELVSFGSEIAWLADDEALMACRRASDYSSTMHYGLNTAAFPSIERLKIEKSGPESREWLATRVGCGDERLLLVFDEGEVCVVRAAFFVEQWRDFFCPSRDDVVILPERGGWALFYCHEDEFEFGSMGEPSSS